MSTIFTSTHAHALKRTLSNIIMDKTDGFESKALFTKWCDVRSQSDNYEDDLEVAGPGLVQAKTEGGELATGTMREGYLTRYRATTYGLKLIITKEALEDNKYPEIIRAARYLKKATWRTADIDATQMLVYMFSTAYPHAGTGQPLCSASQPLPDGGTYSNTMATPMSPSVQAVSIALSSIMKLPGHDSEIEGYEGKQILSPTEQWGVWASILKSTQDPAAGNFAKINVVKSEHNLKSLQIKWWNNTTTNWAIQTDVENGVQFRWRVRPEARNWVDNDNDNMKYSTRARWSRGWSDPRGIYGVQA